MDGKQKIGDQLFELLKLEHGKLAGKIVGMLLEGLPNERLSRLVHSPQELSSLVTSAVLLLQIQNLELPRQGVISAEDLKRLAFLVTNA